MRMFIAMHMCTRCQIKNHQLHFHRKITKIKRYQYKALYSNGSVYLQLTLTKTTTVIIINKNKILKY